MFQKVSSKILEAVVISLDESLACHTKLYEREY